MARGAPVDKAGRYPFPNRFMVLPDINLSFGPLEGDIYSHGVRARFTYRDMAEVMLTWIGGYAFKFWMAARFSLLTNSIGARAVLCPMRCAKTKSR